MVELIVPTTRLHLAWLDAHAEWGPGLHEDGFGLLVSDETFSEAGFSAWVKRLVAAGISNDSGDPTSSRCMYRWIVERDDVLGGIALRYGDSEFIRSAGNIGYGIRPSARRRGLATLALGHMLKEAALLGINRVLLVCDSSNVDSAATIERNGGVFESVRETEHGVVKRYWITTA
jgi:predicted acetyltransferase